MRITGGELRSRRLKGPSRGMPLRPTPDVLRERAFAVLGDRVHGARVLDLFAGTGAVGLEALSRGAASVVFVDHHPAAAKLIAANRDSLGLAPERGRIVVRPALVAVRRLAAEGAHFDLVWADPPFDDWTLGLEALEAVATGGLLAEEGLLCLECPARAEIPAASSLVLARALDQGASRLLLLAPTEGLRAEG